MPVRSRPGALVAALLGLAALLALPARADYRYVWETLDTPHFEIHYHQGHYLMALKLARLAEEAHARLQPLLDHRPVERCQVVLIDDTDYSNGNATPLLYNQVHAFAAPPDPRSTLSEFDDYVWELISHEYTHILHLDTVRGLPALVNDVFGKLWIPNGGQPTWFIEGMAVLSESRLTSGGRLRSSLEEMTARAQALESRFPAIDRLSNPTLEWPRGSNPYTLGGRFLGFIESEYGPGALRDLSHDFGGRAIPLALNLSAERVLGSSYLDLYKEYRAGEEGRAQETLAAVRGGGETHPELLTRLGELTRSPRFSRDGKTLYYSSAGADRQPELRALPLPPCCAHGAAPEGQTLPGDRRLATSFGEATLAVAPDGALVYSRPQVFQESGTIEDLYRFDNATGDQQRLTRGLRASDPDVAPDGALVFVQRFAAGRTAISVLEPGADFDNARVVFEDPAGGPVGSPRWSPSGGAIVFVHHRESWDLRLVARDGSGLVDLTNDRALDRDPSFSPDGAWVLFSSDRSGIYDIYALRLADRLLLRATRVASGAFEPVLSPDGSQLAFVTYSARGYDLARAAWDTAHLEPVTAPAAADAERPPPTPAPPDELFPSRPYDPLPTLLPKWWLPYFGGDAAGTVVGVVTSGTDAVGRHDYAGSAWWGVDGRQPGWDLRYTSHALYPDLTLTASRDLVNPVGFSDVTERQVHAGVSATFPLTAYERAFAFTAGDDLTRLATNSAVGDRPPGGTLASLTLLAAYSDAHSFVRGVSAEEGRKLQITFRVADPALGGDFAFRQLAGSFSTYLALPWTFRDRPLHHALALRLSGGVSRGDLSERHLYSLGGFDTGDWIHALINPQSAATRVLRGFARDSLSGESFALGTLEYRFPIADLEFGPWTLPLYFRRLHAALFTDAGDAFTLRLRDFQLRAGAGAELRAEVILGWYLPTQVRAGCARGLTGGPEAIWDCYAVLGGIF